MTNCKMETDEDQINSAGIAGNHIAAALIGAYGPAFSDWDIDKAQREMTLDWFDVWVAWRILMDIAEHRRKTGKA